jgi:GT2 family glycosyltransferase
VPDPRPPDVTVIVHTRNRAGHLAEVLDRLGGQQTHGTFAYDVLVVDNGSTDGTRDLLEQRRPTFPVPLRSIHEARPGRPWALNAGLAAAGAPILAFTDDDTVPEPSWLHALWSCLVEEGADAATGRVLPLWLGVRPAWLTDEAFREIGRLGCLDHGPRRLRSSRQESCRWLTSNLALRRDAARRLGGWDVRLRYHQDTEYYHRALAAGLSIVYEPAAVVRHKIGPERLTPAYFRRRRRHGGRYRALEAGWRRRHLWSIMPLRLYARIGRFAWEWLRSSLRREPWWRRFHRELQLREALDTGWHRLRLWPRWWAAVLSGRSSMP